MLKMIPVFLIFFNNLLISHFQQERPTIQWVKIPAGNYTMGSNINDAQREEDEISHKVKLKSFKMSKYEITFEQFDAFCKATKRKRPFDEGLGRGKLPVVNVSWEDANSFAMWMGCRLPTEAEWEYACRAKTNTPYNKGFKLTKEQANFESDNSVEVGNYPPNRWGLFDMHGNVWEWCSDWFGNYPSEKQKNPKGPSSGSFRVFRGGSWCFNVSYCRSAYRDYDYPDFKCNNIGFRIVLVD